MAHVRTSRTTTVRFSAIVSACLLLLVWAAQALGAPPSFATTPVVAATPIGPPAIAPPGGMSPPATVVDEPTSPPQVQLPDRAPDAGSRPRYEASPAPTVSTPSASTPEVQAAGWNIPVGPTAGGRLFVAGFVMLVLSIGGLVTVGIWRRHF